MSQIIAIMQPTYIPWVGYLAMIEKSDQFVFLDNVQFNHRSWQQRNRIKTSKGGEWLTISAITKGRSSQLIHNVECTNLNNDIKNHLLKISRNYSKAPFFKEFYPELFHIMEETCLKSDNLLSLFNIEIIKFLCDYIGIKKKFLLSSQMPVVGQKDELLANICVFLKGVNYFSAVGSKIYLEASEQFNKNNISIAYHNYTQPLYPQLHGDFIEGMSCIDMVFNTPRENLKKIIMSGCQ
ncbi:MAG: WbqC family protein [Candidatus Paracaedibacter sp.]